MAEVYKTWGGKRFEKGLAAVDFVQDFMDETIFEMGVRAEEDLLNHRHDGHSFIDVERGRVDRFLILNDDRGQKAAMSIEYGRQAGEYVDEETGQTKQISAMAGLFILHKAARMKRKRKRKIALGQEDL